MAVRWYPPGTSPACAPEECTKCSTQLTLRCLKRKCTFVVYLTTLPTALTVQRLMTGRPGNNELEMMRSEAIVA